MSNITDELPSIVGNPMTLMLNLMKVIVTISGFVMAVTFGVVVVVRYGFGGDLFAYEEWLLAISIMGFFAGAVLAAERDSHIRADILKVIISNRRIDWWHRLFVLSIELLVTLFFVYACYVSLLDDFSFPRLRSTPVLRIPFVSWRITILIAFGIIAMFLAAKLYLHARPVVGALSKSENEIGGME